MLKIRKIWLPLLLVFSVGHFAQSNQRASRLGQISAINGEVLVRKKNTWRRLARAPFDIFDSDKIVTRNGRAEIQLKDGGIIRLNADTNVSLAKQDMVTPTKIIKNAPIEIRILVGDVWVEHKAGGTKITVKMPSATLSLEGKDSGEISGRFMVDLDGATEYGIVKGAIVYEDMKSAQTIDEPQPITKEEISSALPGADSTIDSSSIQQAAIQAVQAHTATGPIVSEFRQKIKVAKELEGDSKLQYQKAVAQQVNARANVAIAVANAKMALIDESIADAVRFGQADLIAAVRQNRQLANDHITTISDISIKLQSELESLETAKTVDEATRQVMRLKIYANIAIANSAAVQASCSLSLAILKGGTYTLTTVDSLTTESRRTADDSVALSDVASDNIRGLKISANAAALSANCAQHLAFMAMNTVANDQSNQASANAVVQCQLSSRARKMAAAGTGLADTNKMLDKIENPVKEKKQALLQDLALNIENQIKPPPIEPLDLGTASPSK